jgi:hypothetical protein
VLNYKRETQTFTGDIEGHHVLYGRYDRHSTEPSLLSCFPLAIQRKQFRRKSNFSFLFQKAPMCSVVIYF